MKELGLVLAVVLSLFGSCKRMKTDERLLAVGGTHAFEGAGCKLGAVEPPSAVKDLEWSGQLVVEARGEGTMEVVCGGKTTKVRLVVPARVSVVLTEKVVVGQRFHVRAALHDKAGREVDIGKYTDVVWRGDGVLVRDNDPSAGEFGFCDTCFGMQGFRATAAGSGTIEASMGGVSASTTLQVGP